MKRVTITTILSLIFGGAVGYGAAYLLYVPIIQNSYIQIINLNQTISAQESQISNQEDKILTQEIELSTQKDIISTLEFENSNYQIELDQAEASIANYKDQLSTQRAQTSSLQSRLNSLLGITVNQYYTWEYQNRDWYWNIPISLSDYVACTEESRPYTVNGYINMAKDSRNVSFINEMIEQINAAGFSGSRKLNFVISFVQGLPYTVDNVTTPYDEYPRYPIETLFDRGGDCEDTSILTAAILHRMGYDVALLHLQDAQHMAVGVAISNVYGSYYEHDGKQYFYLETTGEGWEIGSIPPSITETSALIYPL